MPRAVRRSRSWRPPGPSSCSTPRAPASSSAARRWFSPAPPSGGRRAPAPKSARVKLGGKPPLLVDDLVTIAGCAFNVSGAPSPCLRVQWLMPATRVKIEGSPALLSSSVALCLNAAGAPQGTAVLSGFQTRVRGQ